MLFSAITKNSIQEILTKNIVTFKDENYAWKNLISWVFTEKSNFWEEFTKNQHVRGPVQTSKRGVGVFEGAWYPKAHYEWVHPPLLD